MRSIVLPIPGIDGPDFHTSERIVEAREWNLRVDPRHRQPPEWASSIVKFNGFGHRRVGRASAAFLLPIGRIVEPDDRLDGCHHAQDRQRTQAQQDQFFVVHVPINASGTSGRKESFLDSGVGDLAPRPQLPAANGPRNEPGRPVGVTPTFPGVLDRLLR